MNNTHCPYCGSPDLTQCIKVIIRHTQQGMLYRWMLVMIDRHDTTNVDVWFYPTWQHATDLQTYTLECGIFATV